MPNRLRNTDVSCRVNYPPQKHWIDVACVGESGYAVRLTASMGVLSIKVVGRGSRQMCRMDQYGFPRTGPKAVRTVHGFRTGDLVRAVVPKGRHTGIHTGYAAVRASGSFRIGNADGVSCPRSGAYYGGIVGCYNAETDTVMSPIHPTSEDVGFLGG